MAESRKFQGWMKECSKCKKVLPLYCFWRGPNKSGIYPSCKDCERHKRHERQRIRPMCFRCGLVPHAPKSEYYADCLRILQNKPPRKWVSRRTGLEWCKICESKPKLPYHQYCADCRREYDNLTRFKNRRKKYANSKRRIFTARAYATGLLQRGKIKRGPCVFCGCPGVDFHHYDYLPRTRNFDSVCEQCHVDIHRFLKILLTLMRSKAIRLTTADAVSAFLEA